MNCEKLRRLSFDNNWKSCISTDELAKSGFFLLNKEHQTTMCSFCNLVLHRWECTDEVFKEHKKYRPDCPMITKSRCTNIPIPKRIDPISLEPSTFVSPLCPKAKKFVFVMT